MKELVIVDYGMGNLRSVEKGLEKSGVQATVTSDPKDVDGACGVVLPGVGAFADAIDHLKKTGLFDAVLKAIDSGRPFLGICLGLQLLFERSYEDGEHEGLGVLKGAVERLPSGVKIPHMGWNQVKWVEESPIAADIPDGADFYFVHSYVARPEDRAVIACVTGYGEEFVSGVAKDNVYAFQFHPEKSSRIGLTILRNFGRLCRS